MICKETVGEVDRGNLRFGTVHLYFPRYLPRVSSSYLRHQTLLTKLVRLSICLYQCLPMPQPCPLLLTSPPIALVRQNVAQILKSTLPVNAFHSALWQGQACELLEIAPSLSLLATWPPQRNRWKGCRGSQGLLTSRYTSLHDYITPFCF